jgi:quinol monooxygenase YgiN
MAHLLIRHRVKDYPSWKNTFDGMMDTRRKNGEKSFQILHPKGDRNNLYLLMEWSNLDQARSFMESPVLKENMRKAGVTENPEIHYLEEETKGKL